MRNIVCGGCAGIASFMLGIWAAIYTNIGHAFLCWVCAAVFFTLVMGDVYVAGGTREVVRRMHTIYAVWRCQRNSPYLLQPHGYMYSQGRLIQTTPLAEQATKLNAALAADQAAFRQAMVQLEKAQHGFDVEV